MHLKSLLLPIAAVFGVVVADGAAIVTAMSLVASDSVALNDTLGPWKGNPLTILKVLAESTKLLIDINQATSTAKDSANLTLDEGITVAQETLHLSTIVQSLLATIVAKKHIFAELLLQVAILLELEADKSATDKFAAAVSAKLPEALQGSAGQLTKPIDDAFGSAIAAYEKFW